MLEIYLDQCIALRYVSDVAYFSFSTEYFYSHFNSPDLTFLNSSPFEELTGIFRVVRDAAKAKASLTHSQPNLIADLDVIKSLIPSNNISISSRGIYSRVSDTAYVVGRSTSLITNITQNGYPELYHILYYLPGFPELCANFYFNYAPDHYIA